MIVNMIVGKDSVSINFKKYVCSGNLLIDS